MYKRVHGKKKCIIIVISKLSGNFIDANIKKKGKNKNKSVKWTSYHESKNPLLGAAGRAGGSSGVLGGGGGSITGPKSLKQLLKMTGNKRLASA